MGPSDAAIHLYGEDLDLGLRAELAGVASYFAPGSATLVHEGKASTSLVFDDLARSQAARNGRAVRRRHFGPRPERPAWLAELLNLSLRLAAKWALRRERAWDRPVLAALIRARLGGFG